MITEDYVSFETAKLLKEKGFDEPCYAYWHEDENKLIISQSMHAIRNFTNPCFFGPAVPTIQMAIKWLREVHSIAIVITPSMFWGRYNAAIYKRNNVYPFGFDGSSLIPSYEDAAEAAIKYCLENLI